MCDADDCSQVFLVIAQNWAEPHAHCAFEATPTLLVAVATSLVSCRLRAPPPAPPADSRLAGSREKLDGLRKRGVVTRLGAGFPVLVLANSRLVFPSMEVRGKAPPDARAEKYKHHKHIHTPTSCRPGP